MKEAESKHLSRSRLGPFSFSLAAIQVSVGYTPEPKTEIRDPAKSW